MQRLTKLNAEHAKIKQERDDLKARMQYSGVTPLAGPSSAAAAAELTAVKAENERLKVERRSMEDEIRRLSEDYTAAASVWF